MEHLKKSSAVDHIKLKSKRSQHKRNPVLEEILKGSTIRKVTGRAEGGNKKNRQ